MNSGSTRPIGLRAVLATALALLLAAPALAAVPLLMNYQGYLTDSSNNPRQGNFKMAFTIFPDSTTGAALWSETYASVNVSGGLFNVVLGTVTPLPPAAFSGAKLWLETAVSDTTLAPRRPLVTVPYSFRARTADTAYVALASGGDITGTVQFSCTGNPSGVLVYIPGRSFVAYTAAGGAFDLGAVPPGTYTVHVESFSPAQSTNLLNVTVTAGNTTNLGTVTLGSNLQTDVNNCGTCGNVCGGANGTPSCVSGNCQIACNAGYANCDNVAANGCEVNTTNSVNNCGACGNACPTGPNSVASCVNSTCSLSCSSGYLDCNANAFDGCEVHVTTDVNNCGGCGNHCGPYANAAAVCTGGSCQAVCNTGYLNCNGNNADGCEVNVINDANNCGSCGHVCPSGHACVAAVCQ